MALITSRSFVLPQLSDAMRTYVWFNMWTRKLWPYNELDPGETLLWYESPNQRIVWSTNVTDVTRFPYSRREEVADKLKLSAVDARQPYLVDAPASGFCLSYKVDPIERLEVSRPDDLRFPQQGWLRINESVVQKWPALASFV
ncbi:MAG TPA: hypothetical protein VN937_11015 [Blastocatellia bacterium]|nr:hypothetical protein [Blastocatellia bacterium]